MGSSPIQLLPGERLVKSKMANHFKGFEGVGGKLHLTDMRVVFKSHALNYQIHTEAYLYSEIARVETYMNMGIMPNGLRLILHDGRREKFVVWGRKKLKKYIEERISQ